MNSQLIPFVLPQRGVRGFAVELSAGISEMMSWRAYPPDVARLLGQVLAATPLLAADLRAESRMNLQFKGNKDLGMLVTQIDQDLNLRGMAEFTPVPAGTPPRDFQALMQGGLLACIMEPKAGAQTYQAVVEILGYTLAEALELYFARSEQLPTLMRLAARPDKFAGVMLQKLPKGEVVRGASEARSTTERTAKDGGAGGSEDSESLAMDGHMDRDEENWNTVNALFATLGEAELLAVDNATLLRRLFAGEEFRVAEPRPVRLACRCSHAAISAMLLGLGEEELAPVLKERGHVEVTCEFCGRNYRYVDIEVRQLFAGAQLSAGGSTLQ